MLLFKRVSFKDDEFAHWDEENPRVTQQDPVLLLDTVSNVKAADQVRLIN